MRGRAHGTKAPRGKAPGKGSLRAKPGMHAPPPASGRIGKGPAAQGAATVAKRAPKKGAPLRKDRDDLATRLGETAI